MNKCKQCSSALWREFERLELENAKLKKDKQRLDWMQKYCCKIIPRSYFGSPVVWSLVGNPKSARAAIDAAMKGQTEKGGKDEHAGVEGKNKQSRESVSRY